MVSCPQAFIVVRFHMQNQLSFRAYTSRSVIPNIRFHKQHSSVIYPFISFLKYFNWRLVLSRCKVSLGDLGSIQVHWWP